MEYFRSTITGKIVTSRDIWSANDILGKDASEKMLADGAIEPVEEPSIIDCIKSGGMPAAFSRYCEIHNCGMAEAKEAVRNMRSDYYRLHNIRNKKHKAQESEQEAV